MRSRPGAPAPGRARAPATSQVILVTFIGAHVVNDFYATVLPAFLPAIADEFALDYTELGVLSFSFTVCTGILQPLVGNAADRRGIHRGVLVAGFGAAAVGFVAMASSPSFWFVVAVSLLCGLGASTYHPQATTFIVTAYPDRRGRMLGLHGLGGSAGHFLAPAVTVFVVAAVGWRWTMLLLAVPLAASAVTTATVLDPTIPQPQARLRSVVSRQLVVVGVTFGLLGIVGRSYLTFLVKMLVDEGWRETDAGVVLTLILLVSAVAQPLGGRLYDRRGGRTTFVGASLGAVACAAVFAVTTGAISLVAVAGVQFFVFALFPVGLAMASRLGAGQTGAAAGVVFGVSGLMTATSQPLVGAIAELTGDLRSALGWLVPVGLLAVILAVRVAPET